MREIPLRGTFRIQRCLIPITLDAFERFLKLDVQLIDKKKLLSFLTEIYLSEELDNSTAREFCLFLSKEIEGGRFDEDLIY